MTTPPDRPPGLILYDAACGLCDGMVRFVLARDARRHFRFAPLDSELARNLLARHGLAGSDTVVLVDGDRAYAHSTAALLIAVELDTPWPLLGLLGHVPLVLRDSAYAWVAKHRRQWFKSPACPVVAEGFGDRFVATPEDWPGAVPAAAGV